MYRRMRIIEFAGRTPEEMPESRPEEMPNELYKDREVITPNGPEKPEKSNNTDNPQNKNILPAKHTKIGFRV